MKKFFLTIAIVIIGMVSIASAQTIYTWESYNVSFTILSDLKVTTNADAKFEAVSSAGDIYFGCTPNNYEGTTEEELGKAVAELAYETAGIDPTTAEINVFQCQGGEGMYIVGKDKDGTHCLIAMVFNTASQVKNSIVVVEYFAEARAEDAGKMLSLISFNK
ncbi:MAG: hypothetical protein K6F33_03835 [Bacteroidales bacterium]|nr:hypothetical protein [Bacteroidales bacterium]